MDCTAAQWVRAGQAELVAAFCAAATQCLVLANAPPPHDTFGGGFQRRMTIMKKSWAKEQLGEPQSATALAAQHVARPGN